MLRCGLIYATIKITRVSVTTEVGVVFIAAIRDPDAVRRPAAICG